MKPSDALRITILFVTGLMGLAFGTRSAAAQIFNLQNEAAVTELTMDRLINLATQDLNAFWNVEFGQSGWTYTAPYTLQGYDYAIETPCGEALLWNAFYCGTDHNIYYHVSLLAQIFTSDDFGDFGMVTVLAHEWAHAIQAQMPLQMVPAFVKRDRELQADCLAGAYAQYLSDGRSQVLRLEEGDLEEGATFLYSIGDDLPWFDPQAHGSSFHRSYQFVVGLVEGLAACFPLTTYQDPANAYSIQYPQPWQVKYDESWNSDASSYTKTFLMAPPRAEQAELHGYLSEGIRINLHLPPSGRVWTDTYQAEWLSTRSQNVLNANPDFTLAGSTQTFFAGQPAQHFVIQGTDQRISEPETTSIIAVARPDYLLQVEITSPASKFEYHRYRLEELVNTFTIGSPEAPPR